MKNFKLVALLLFLGIVVSCKKAPTAVTLSSDKTALIKGETAYFTLNVEGDATWYEIFRKSPGETSYTTYGGSTSVNYFRFTTDSTTQIGTYYFYAEARNCGKGNTESGKKCKSLISSDITITVN